MPDPVGPPPNPDRDLDPRDKAVEAAAAELVPFWEAVKKKFDLPVLEQVFLLNLTVGRSAQTESAAAELLPFWAAVKRRHGLTVVEQVFLLNTIVGRTVQVECLLERERNRAQKTETRPPTG